MTQDEQLAAYHKMHTDVQVRYDTVCAKMAALKTDGKEKTATYRQLFSEKLTLGNILTTYKVYGL